jgi:hypothetical protein
MNLIHKLRPAQAGAISGNRCWIITDMKAKV